MILMDTRIKRELCAMHFALLERLSLRNFPRTPEKIITSLLVHKWISSLYFLNLKRIKKYRAFFFQVMTRLEPLK